MTDSTSHVGGASGAGGDYTPKPKNPSNKQFDHEAVSGGSDSSGQASGAAGSSKSGSGDMFKKMLPNATDKEIEQFRKQLEKNLANEFSKAAKRSKEAKEQWQKDDQG